MGKHGIKGALANLCLVIASLLITCGVAEIGLRLRGYRVFGDLESGRNLILEPSANPDVKYELVPGASGYAWGTQVKINAHGHRGRMGEPGKFGGFRAIVLGDSITFGNLLPVEATYAEILQTMLDGSGARYEVLNFGVGGYDTLQEVALLENRGLSYKPDLVVVAFCLNDIGIASPNLEYIERVKRYRSNWLLSISRLAQLITRRLDRIQIEKWMEEKNQEAVFAKDYAGRIAPLADDERELQALMRRLPSDYPSNWYRSAVRIGRLRYAFEHLAALAGRESFSVVILIVPWLVDGHTYPHQVAHEIVNLEARRVGFDTLEVLQDFMDAGIESLRISSADDVHPNAKGHQIIAAKLARFVSEKRHNAM
jgi:lysophospholipase L1-like esterase